MGSTKPKVDFLRKTIKIDNCLERFIQPENEDTNTSTVEQEYLSTDIA